MHSRYNIHILNHNYNPKPLLREITDQIHKNQAEIRVVVWDDGSDAVCQHQLVVLQKEFARSPVTWVTGVENVGRARMRQNILDFDQEGWIVCLDSDMVPDEDFVEQMVALLVDPAQVYLGQHYYQVEIPFEPFRLHWYYGKKREVRRNENLRRHFSTGIFALHSSLTPRLSFDQHLTGYGHEDTLFGLQLENLAIPVKRIPLKAQHDGLDPFGKFLEKQYEAVHNLQYLQKAFPGYRNGLIKWGRRFRSIPGLSTWIGREAFRAFCIQKLERNPERLFYLDLWKLSIYLSEERSGEGRTQGLEKRG